MNTRKIAVFTGSRAEYGLLVPVIRAIEAQPELELQLVVSGDHVDGVQPAAQIDIKRQDETPASTSRAIGAGVLAMTDVLERLAPDAVVIYGDRFEAFAAMIAATQMGLPVGHLEGGDLTQGGTLDDVVRHAMSKLAHLHFPTNGEAAERLKAMGEEDWRIETVGFPPIDLIQAGDFADAAEVGQALDLDPEKPLVLFTLHPISTTPEAAATEARICLDALAKAQDELRAQLVLTYPNGDVGSDAIISELLTFSEARDGVVLRQSLGRRLYHGVLAVAGAGRGVCVGNSSSGLKETQAFKCPAVDIAPRQAGRLAGENVMRVGLNADAIFAAIRTAIADDAFRARVLAAENPYGQGNAGPRIAEILTQVDLADPALVVKQTVL